MVTDDNEDALESVERAGNPTHEQAAPTEGSEAPQRLLLRQKAERFEFNLLTSELDEFDDEEERHAGGDRQKKPVLKLRHADSVRKSTHDFWKRRTLRKELLEEEDPYFDTGETTKFVVVGSKEIDAIPTIRECQKYLKNAEADAYRRKTVTPGNRVVDMVMNVISALAVWAITMLSLESLVVVINASLATYVYCQHADDFAAKLDFSFLAFAVVFPLTFLIQSTFARREQALLNLADFKSAVLSAALVTLTVDWPDADGGNVSGRLALPRLFNTHVVQDFRELVQLVYEYLSMPNINHARNIMFLSRTRDTMRVRALQNDIVKNINENMYDLAMHTEEMRKAGFQSGEASRLHQYHQFLQQRFEHLRALKYYRTPQATRSFGRAYISILPWLCGPYFAWVFESTNLAYAIALSAFTFLIVLGLLKTQEGLEDPFMADFKSWLPGIDTVKLDFELAVVLQALEQYFANAEVQRSRDLQEKKRRQSKHEEEK